MDNELPTEEDMMTCAGCGSMECDSSCDEYAELERKCLEDEAKGIFIPSYCGATHRQFCTLCHKAMPYDFSQAICADCFLRHFK